MGVQLVHFTSFLGIKKKIQKFLNPPPLLEGLPTGLNMAPLANFTGFAKTFCPPLVILSDEAGVLHQTFWVFVSHFTLKMGSKYDYFAGHFV